METIRSASKRSLLLVLLAAAAAFAQEGAPPPRETPAARAERMAWWREARFGLFLHWGLYAVPAGAWNGETNHGEWIRTTARIPVTEYDKLLSRFDPQRFDARAWVRMAKDAGMRYIVITSKHHDGFALFDASASEFDVMATPFRRDILRELAEACRAEGMKLCFYYSIMDWHHPDYLPRREWEKDRSAEGAEFGRYLGYMKSELRDLLANYGDIGVLWFDGEWESTWSDSLGRDLEAYVRSLQPGIIVNNRVGASRSGLAGFSTASDAPGDFGTPEQEIPARGIPGVDWESCMTMNDHWGFNAADTNFKSTAELLRNLADIASKGGNFLLNVGPTAAGEFPRESVERLAEIGAWMRLNGESIRGTQASPFTTLPGAVCTRRALGPATTRLYLHLLEWPEGGTFRVPGLLNDPAAAFLLADSARTRLTVARDEDALLLKVGPRPAGPGHGVVVLDVAGEPDIADAPTFDSDVRVFVGAADVVMRSSQANVQVRYTLDGSVPTASSPVAAGPVRCVATTTVTARSFRGERPVSAVAAATFAKVDPWPAARLDAAMVPGLRYAYYEGEWDSLPAFGALSAAREGVVPNVTFSPRRQDERFGFRYTGFITVPADGIYEFFTESDDGSRLLIDGVPVVNNDYLHGMQERRGIAPLGAGPHRLEVLFFERTGGDDLRISYAGPGIAKRAIPDGVLTTERTRP